MHPEIKIVARAFVLACFALCIPRGHAQMTGSVGGSVDQTGPALPQILLASTINSTNFPDLFPPAVTEYVCASGTLGGHACKYTSLSAAIAGIPADDGANCSAGSEAIIVDDKADGFVADSFSGNSHETYTISCPAGKHIWVQTWGISSLSAQGTRVQPSDKNNMFQIQYSCTTGTCKFNQAFYYEDGSSGLIISGMDLEVSGTNVGAIFAAGSDTNSSNFASRLMLDRVYLDAPSDYSTLINNALVIDAPYFIMTDSVIDHVAIQHSDSCNTYTEAHDVLAKNSVGPIKLVDDAFLGDPTENLLWGGALPANRLTNPSDVEFRRSLAAKDPSNIATASVKNLFETKSMVRLLADGNVLQYSYNDGLACQGQQYAGAITANVGVVNATDVFAEVRDMTWTNNVIQHTNKAVDFQGYSASSAFNGWPVTQHILFENNLWQDQSVAYNGNVFSLQPVSSATIASNQVTYTVASTAGFSATAGITGNTFVAYGFTGADSPVFNVYLGKVASLTGTTITANLTAPNQAATSTGFIYPLENTESGILMVNGGTYDTPPGAPGNYAASACTTDANGNTTCAVTTTCPGTGPGGCLQSGQILKILGGSPSCLNVGTGSLAKILNVTPATFTFHSGCPSGAATTPPNNIFAEIPAPAPFSVTFDHDGFYGGVCPASFLGSAVNCPSEANGEQFTYFSSPLGCGSSQIAGMAWTNLIFVGDAAHPNGDCSQQVSAWVANGALPGFIAYGNVFPFAVTTGTACANWPTSGPASNPGTCFPTQLNALNPSTVSSALGMSNYATCAAGDSYEGPFTSLASCAITGTFANAGPNISAIQAAQAEPNDSTKWGPRTSW